MDCHGLKVAVTGSSGFVGRTPCPALAAPGHKSLSVESADAVLMEGVARGFPLPLASICIRRSLVYVGNLVDAIIACLAGRKFFFSPTAKPSRAPGYAGA